MALGWSASRPSVSKGWRGTGTSRRAASVMFHMAGGDEAAFMAAVRADPQTYASWAGNGEWHIETTGTEDDLYSPFLRNPFRRAVDEGVTPADLTRGEIEGRRQAMHAVEALRQFMPGCDTARLRNFGMTIGIRDTRKIESVHDMREAEVRGEARFDDSIGVFPEFIDGYGVLVLPTTGRYFHLPYRNLPPCRI